MTTIDRRDLVRGAFATTPVRAGRRATARTARWTNAAHTRFMLFEQSSPSSDMNHREAAPSDYGSYSARRAHNIRD